MDRLLNLMTAFSVLLIALVLASLRKAHIRVEYSVSWLGVGVLLLVLSQSRGLLNGMAGFLGVGYPPAALLFIILGIAFLVFFRFSMIISALKDSNIALAQRVAILEFELRALDRRTHE